MNKQEEKDSRIGILTSVGIHISMFLLLFFIVAWRAPNPPLPEFGIELNFGLDNQGSGDEQPVTPVGDETNQQAEEIQEQSAESQPEEVKTEVKEDVKDVPEAATDKVVSKEVSDVAVKEEKKEVKTEVKDKPKETIPKEKLVAEYKKENKKEVVPTEGTKKGDPGNQGDDSKKTGDKGNPDGKLDAKALYGTPGGGGGGDGLNLSMAGWAWAEEPKIPDLPDNESGRVSFIIECDENGDIIGITTEDRGLSAKSEQILKEVIRKNSLIRTSGGKAPEKSKGRIVFVLKTK